MAEAGDATQSKPREGRLRWVLGWIVLPGTLITALFLAGVHVGARHPEMGLSRLLLKVFGSKPGVAEPSKPPVEFEPRPGAKPGEPFEYTETLTAKQLDAIAEKSLGLDVDELECEFVCRTYAKTVDAAIYSINHCELARPVRSAPGVLICRGKLEAAESGETKRENSDKPADDQKQAE